jgi:predicted O-methyltransferase YrrM
MAQMQIAPERGQLMALLIKLMGARKALEMLGTLITGGDLGRFDFAFIDADKENHAGYYERSLTLAMKRA